MPQWRFTRWSFRPQSTLNEDVLVEVVVPIVPSTKLYSLESSYCQLAVLYLLEFYKSLSPSVVLPCVIVLIVFAYLSYTCVLDSNVFWLLLSQRFLIRVVAIVCVDLVRSVLKFSPVFTSFWRDITFNNWDPHTYDAMLYTVLPCDCGPIYRYMYFVL